MTQEQFEALGIEKSLAKKAADASVKELEGYGYRGMAESINDCKGSNDYVQW